MARCGEFLDDVDPRITIHSLECMRVRQVPLRLTRFLRECQPDVTLVHMWPLTSASVFAWLLAGKPGKIYACDHIGITDHVERDLHIPLLVARATLRVTYPKASGILAVSKGVAKDLAQLSGLPEEDVQVIHNPVVPADLPPIVHPPDPHIRTPLWRGQFRSHVLSVGTLKAQKNHRLLLQAFACVATELDSALVILGEGSLRLTLEQDLQELGLQGRVLLPGFHPDPTPWYQMADLFVLSSDYEGFANVVAEALACGTPVVSTDCRHGPAEILEHGRYGRLVPVGDTKALAAAIQASLLESHDHQSLRRRAQDFTVTRIADQYLTYFRSMADRL